MHLIHALTLLTIWIALIACLWMSKNHTHTRNLARENRSLRAQLERAGIQPRRPSTSRSAFPETVRSGR